MKFRYAPILLWNLFTGAAGFYGDPEVPISFVRGTKCCRLEFWSYYLCCGADCKSKSDCSLCIYVCLMVNLLCVEFRSVSLRYAPLQTPTIWKYKEFLLKITSVTLKFTYFDAVLTHNNPGPLVTCTSWIIVLSNAFIIYLFNREKVNNPTVKSNPS